MQLYLGTLFNNMCAQLIVSFGIADFLCDQLKASSFGIADFLCDQLKA